MFDAGLLNLVIVLAFTRLPIYMRTARAEVLEIRERLFVSAAISMGARIVEKHFTIFLHVIFAFKYNNCFGF